MAVSIRMKRIGRKRRPFYRIEAINKRNSRSGKSLEVIGNYDPLVSDRKAQIKFNSERLKFWIDKGARPSHRIATFMKKLDVKFGGAKSSKSRKALLRQRRATRRKAGGAAVSKKGSK